VLALICSFWGIYKVSCVAFVEFQLIFRYIWLNSEKRFSHIKLEFMEISVKGNTVVLPYLWFCFLWLSCRALARTQIISLSSIPMLYMLLAISHFVAILVLKLIVEVLKCLCSSDSYLP
jgi:hypothetical protein